MNENHLGSDFDDFLTEVRDGEGDDSSAVLADGDGDRAISARSAEEDVPDGNYVRV